MEATILFRGIGIAIQLAEVVLAIKEAPEDTKRALRFIKDANDNLDYTRKLCSKRKTALSENPDLKERVDKVIESVEIALYDIGKRVEDARVDLSTKDKVSLIRRVTWLMGDKDAYEKRISNVMLVHGSLLGVINSLERLPLDVKRISLPSHTTDGLASDDFPRSSYQRNAKYLKSLTIRVTDFDGKTSTTSECCEISEQLSPLLATKLAGGKRARAVSEPPAPSRPAGDATKPPLPEAHEQSSGESAKVTPLKNRLGEIYSQDLDSMLVKRMKRAAEMSSKSPEPEPKRAKQ
jgi:hypothetical protein